MPGTSSDTTTKYVLAENDLPTRWYNIQADFKTPAAAVLHPGTHQPIGPQDLAPLFPMELIKQEVSQERWIEIPDEVRDVLRLWRPSPLYRARRLEKALDTPARIYYKYEGVSPAGSHKPNTAVPQAYYNKMEGVTRMSTETGAGQWGSALAIARAFFGVEVEVFMVKVSFQQKPYRHTFMESFGARCIWVEKLGGQGVFIPGEEVYTALQTGALHGVTWGSGMGMYSMKFHEVCKYFLNPPLMPVNHMSVIVNQKAWDSLTPDLRQMLEFGFIKAGMDMTNHQNFTGEQWSLNEMKRKHKVTIHTLAGEDLKAAKKAAYEIWDEEAKKSPSCAELVQKIKDFMKAMGHMD